MYPNWAQVVEEEQMHQKEAHDKHCKERQFQLGDPVYMQNFSPRGVKWLLGEIAQITGPVSNEVSVDGSHLIWRRHLDHIRPRYDLDQAFSENPLSLSKDPVVHPAILETNIREQTDSGQEQAGVASQDVACSPAALSVPSVVTPTIAGSLQRCYPIHKR